MEDCLFCKIINKKLPSDMVYEDDICAVFKDINQKSRVHLLLCPRKHIPTIADLEEGDEKLMGHLIKTAKELAMQHSCKGYQLVFNVGKEAGQVIFHIHLHLIGK
ncbi:MAG: HIT domain-containing protein [Patescibacteria group bacterium]